MGSIVPRRTRRRGLRLRAPARSQGSCPAVLASGHRAHALGSRTWNRYSSPPASCEGNARPDAPTAGVVLGTGSCAGATAAHRCDRAVGVSPPGPSSAWARSTRRPACPRPSLAGAPAALLRGPRVAQDVGDAAPRALQACVRAGAAGCRPWQRHRANRRRALCLSTWTWRSRTAYASLSGPTESGEQAYCILRSD